MSVANVLPNDTIVVTLQYTEFLIPTQGTYEFVYPAVVGPRYSNQPARTAPAADHWVETPYMAAGSPSTSAFAIAGVITSGVPVRTLSSTTHALEHRREGPSKVRFELSKLSKPAADRDFILQYRLAGDSVESGLSLYDDGNEGFFTLVVEPPARVQPNELPPREYVFVVDVSGSMHGFPLETAKQMLRELARGLGASDRFNVLLFSGGSRLLSPHSLPATAKNVEHALRVIDQEHGSGGTELLPALRQALSLTRDESIARTFVIVTDGYIEADKQALDFVRANLGRANVFAFGIGTSVNRYLIEGLARAGMGEPFVVTDPSATTEVGVRFRRYIAAPVLTNIRTTYSGFDVYDVTPASIPDVFAERPVVIHGKWRGKNRGTITLTGSSGTGTYERRFDVTQVTAHPDNSALRYLWARNTIATLSDNDDGAPSSPERTRILQLGLKYNLLTRYTSFLAVSEVVRNHNAPATDVTQPLLLPAGVSELTVAESMHGAPEPELWLLLVAVSALLGVAYRARVRRAGVLA